MKFWKRMLAVGFAAGLALGAGLALAGCDTKEGSGGKTDSVDGKTYTYEKCEVIGDDAVAVEQMERFVDETCDGAMLSFADGKATIKVQGHSGSQGYSDSYDYTQDGDKITCVGLGESMGSIRVSGDRIVTESTENGWTIKIYYKLYEENEPGSGNTGGEEQVIGVQVTEAEWNALLDSVATAEEDGMRFLGQNNFKFQVTEEGEMLSSSMTVVSSGNIVHSYAETLFIADNETLKDEIYWQVKGEDAVTVYSYDGDAESWYNGDMAYSDLEASFGQVFLTLGDLNDGLEEIGFDLGLDLYGRYTFDEKTGAYERAIECTAGNGESSYTVGGSASIRFGDGKVLAIAVELLVTLPSGESGTIKYDFTAGGQSVTIPEKVLAAEEAAEEAA